MIVKQWMSTRAGNRWRSFDFAQAFGSEAQARRDGEFVEPFPNRILGSDG